MTLSLFNYINIAITLYLLGVWGIVLNRKNIIILLMSIELMLLAINLNFISFSLFLDDSRANICLICINSSRS